MSVAQPTRESDPAESHLKTRVSEPRIVCDTEGSRGREKDRGEARKTDRKLWVGKGRGQRDRNKGKLFLKKEWKRKKKVSKGQKGKIGNLKQWGEEMATKK